MRPRAIALGVVIHDGRTLVEEQSGRHSRGEGVYYRPIGGTIEFGERSADTVVREYREELGIEVAIVKYYGCLEDIFTVDGQAGHELVQVYEVRPCAADLYATELFRVVEGAKVTDARWIPLADFETGGRVLYPNGLTEILVKLLDSN